MANHKSAAKRARQTLKKTAINGHRKSATRTLEKKIRTLITSSEGEKKKEVPNLLKEYSSQMDKAAKKGVFHKNMAQRKISRLFSLAHSHTKS